MNVFKSFWCWLVGHDVSKYYHYNPATDRGEMEHRLCLCCGKSFGHYPAAPKAANAKVA